MKNVINVVMIDKKESVIDEVKQYFSNQASIEIVKTFTNSKDAEDYLLQNPNNYDCLLMEPIITPIDGVGILKNLHNHKINKNVIIYADYLTENIIKPLTFYDISFFLLKSVSLNILHDRIIDTANLKTNIFEFDFDLTNKVSKLLHELGMPSHIKGYQYIRDSIELMHNDPEYLGCITKQLYPYIADKYNTTSSRVERDMRHAIEVSWARGDYHLMEEIFGNSVDFDRAKPTNSEFLATVTDKINLDEKKIIHYSTQK